jgi:hypothetical protein
MGDKEVVTDDRESPSLKSPRVTRVEKGQKLRYVIYA